VDCNNDQLADSVCGILFSGSGKSNRKLPVLYSPAKNHSGSDNTYRLFRLFDPLSKRKFQVELSRRIYDDDWGGILRIQKMVVLFVPLFLGFKNPAD
jgi:hypothetical protein